MINITTNLADDILLGSISRIDKTNGIINFNLKPKLLLLKEAVILWYDLDKQKATNENMSNNPVIKDFSGNNIYSTCNSFSWDGHSGVGSWPIPKCSITGDNSKLINNYKCIINNINFTGLRFPTISKDNGEIITIRIKVDNVNSDYNLSFYYYNNINSDTPVIVQNKLVNGVTTITINKSEFEDNETRQYYITYRNSGDDSSINTTVEVLQDYSYDVPFINKNDNSYTQIKDGYKNIFTKTNIMTSNTLVCYSLCSSFPANTKIRVKSDSNGLIIYRTGTNGENKTPILTLSPYKYGEFSIDFDYTDDERIMYSPYQDVPIGKQFVIEFIPDYDGYLVYDGIDDFSKSEYFKLSERFTILLDAIFINEDINKTAGILKSSNFYLYNYLNGIYAFVNTGNNAELIPKNLVAVNPKYYYFKDGSKLRVGVNQTIPNLYNSILRIGSNNDSNDRICTKIAIRKIIVFDRILNNKEIDTAIKYFLNPIDIESKIRDSLICHYDIAKQGATNETLSANPVIKDLSNNGNDADLIGFNYKGMSGVGGYYFYEFHSHVSTPDKPCEYDFATDYSKITILKSLKDTNAFYTFLRNIKEGDNVHYKLRITGLDALKTTHPNAIIGNSQGFDGQPNRITQDGDYELNAICGANDYKTVALYLADDVSNFQPDEAINVTMEQLPLYPSALVSDGVDDYAIVKNKYDYDFTERPTWRSFVSQSLFEENTTKNTITLIKTNSAADICYDKTSINIKLRIKGLERLIDNNKLVSLLIYPNKNINNSYVILKDGIYDINITNEQSIDSDAIYFVCSMNQSSIEDDGTINFDEPIIIEQLPTNKSLVLNKDDGYTVIAKRKRIDGGTFLVSKRQTANNLSGGAFDFESDVDTANFGNVTQIVPIESDITYQTSKKYNDSNIGKGDLTDNDALVLFKNSIEDNIYGKFALYSLMLFNRDLTDEEIEYVKTNLI